MDNEMINMISKLLDEKLKPIKEDIEQIKVNSNNNDFQKKIIEDIDYMSGYYYNRTQKCNQR